MQRQKIVKLDSGDIARKARCAVLVPGWRATWLITRGEDVLHFSEDRELILSLLGSYRRRGEDVSLALYQSVDQPPGDRA